jgi:hypothetical protein
MLAFNGGSCEEKFTYQQLNELIISCLKKNFVVAVPLYLDKDGYRSLSRVLNFMSFIDEKFEYLNIYPKIWTFSHCVGIIFI